MKKFAAFALFLTLAACGENSASQSAQSSAAAPAATASAVPATPEERGRKLFNECAVCHTAKQGDANRVGPNLFGIVGAKAGQVDGFAYSKAMQDSGIVWTEETLNAYLENPQTFMRGNRMAYAGQRDAQKRADIIAYMKTLK
jgi:cytochrome c